MSVTRRQLLGGAALAGAVSVIGLRQTLAGRYRPQLVLVDSRRPASLALTRLWPGARTLDLAMEQRNNWRGVRAVSGKGPVSGVTGWNDYVVARGCLEARGLRVREESLDRQHDLIAWTMA